MQNRAVAADPPRDAAHPARNRQVLILSHGEGMNALFADRRIGLAGVDWLDRQRAATSPT